MNSINSSEHWIIGLDIGIASVGWAVITPSRIVNLGVRAFDKAETDKEGESLNLKRRSARLIRHRLFNRQWRMTKLARFLKKEGLFNQVNFFKNQPTFKESSWQLRVAGLNRLLTSEEWARVIYHVCTHRNEKLYGAIRQRLETYVANGGKFTNGESKAFPADQPMRKPDRQGNLTGPIVRSVKLQINKLTGIPVRGGIAKNDTMLRVDVFKKAGKFHLVPVYVHHKVKELPNKAIVAFKDEDEWTLIDESFAFMFSLYPNDLVKIQQKGKHPILGYFASCHRGTAAINIWAQDRKKSIGKDGQIEGIGVKTALSLEKFQVDVLGNIYPAPPEVRSGLA